VKPEVLMTGPMMPMIVDQIDDAFILHRLWEAENPQKLIAEVGPRIRGVAASAYHEPIGEAFFAQLPKLEIVSSFGVGYDHIDAKAAGRHGILVTNTPDVLTDEVADTCLGLVLNTVRQLARAERYLRAGHWRDKPFMLTDSLRGKTAGILGLGRIGKAIAQRLEAFGVECFYHGRTRQNGVPYVYFGSLLEMARKVDILIAVTPGGDETKHLIDHAVMEALGPKGILINVGRGTVVDEKALVQCLQSGALGSAGLDVFEDEPKVPYELTEMEHVVLLPHVGSGSHHTRNAMGQLVVDNLLDWFAGKGPRSPVVETPWKV
jgi:lactate dehydrogenase-like 2-hydroxyacid dehydrogenase